MNLVRNFETERSNNNYSYNNYSSITPKFIGPMPLKQ